MNIIRASVCGTFALFACTPGEKPDTSETSADGTTPSARHQGQSEPKVDSSVSPPDMTDANDDALCCGIPGRGGCVVSIGQLMRNPGRFDGRIVDVGGYLTKVANSWELTLAPLPQGARPRGTGMFLRVDAPDIQARLSKMSGDMPVAIIGMFESDMDNCGSALNGTIAVHYFHEIELGP